MDHSERFTIEDGVLMEYNAPQIVVPEEVREIGDEVFYRSMVSVTLPEGLERIGKWAFRWCGRLRSINIPESVKEIGTGAFERSSIYAISFSRTVKTIGTAAAAPRLLVERFLEKARIAISRQIVVPHPPIKTKQSKKPLAVMPQT